MISLYKASAGSGKTYTLAYEYIRLLLSHPKAETYRHILAVTFTKKATAQMKERILRELYILSSNPALSPYTTALTRELKLDPSTIRERALRGLHSVLQDYTHFSISTIDAFFQQVVQVFAREVGLSAQFTISLDSDLIIKQAIDDLFFALNHRKATSEFESWIHSFALDNIARSDNWNPRDKIQAFSHALFSERLQQILDKLRPALTNKQFLNQYRSNLEAILDNTRSITDTNTADAIIKNLNTLGLLSDVWEQIQSTNREQRRLPIDQVKTLLNRIIDDADSPFIYEKLGTRYHHYMIDEFQDTSAMQWQNFLPLLTESNSHGYRNLIVGDVKQSIYRFRNSDWHLLRDIPQEFPDCVQPTMDTNYRSAHTIVETNNLIFPHYVNWVASIFENSKDMPSELGASIREAYSTLHQKASHTELNGYVHFEWFPSDNTDHFHQQAEEAVLRQLDELRQRHYRMGQITLLVRNSKDAERITNLLLRNNYMVESQQGLLVSSHPAVQVLIHLLRLSLDHEDKLILAELKHSFGKHIYANDSAAYTQFMQSQESFLTPEQQQAIHDAECKPLYEQVQHLIDALQLHTWSRATAYLTAFQDLIYSYSEQQTAEISAFLEYWELKQATTFINAAPSPDALRVMTIHKSKGLEFDVVIIPYLNWSIGASAKDAGKTLWCQPQEPPFNALPYVPISFRKDIPRKDQHAFMPEIYDELCNLYIDNLNLTYVAFTRPIRELYAYAIPPRILKSGKTSISDVGQLLYSILEQEPGFSEDSYCYGETEVFVPQVEKQDAFAMPTVTIPAAYRSTPIGSRLKLSTRGMSPDELSLQDFGTLMHDWLSLILKPEDAEPCLQELIRQGRVREQDIPRMRHEWQQFLQLIAGHDWFSSNYTVVRERDILTASARTLRPDRVMIRDRHAIVIDYKFGEHLSPAHREQVHDYMSQLTHMGYTTEGYLVYVSLSKIVAL